MPSFPESDRASQCPPRTVRVKSKCAIEHSIAFVAFTRPTSAWDANRTETRDGDERHWPEKVKRLIIECRRDEEIPAIEPEWPTAWLPHGPWL